MSKSSAVMEKLCEIRRSLIEREREEAIAALARYLHEVIEPQIRPNTFSVYIFKYDRKKYDAVFGIDSAGGETMKSRAADWVLKDLRDHDYIEGHEELARLTRRGIDEFCE